MHPFPHQYTISASVDATDDVVISGEGLPTMVSASPVEFDGPGGRWSPETLLVAAVLDCFVLTFRAIARVSRVTWITLTCEATGTLDRVERVSQFTDFAIRARLRLPAGGNQEQALRMLSRAEQSCLVTNSLKAPCRLEASVEIAG